MSSSDVVGAKWSDWSGSAMSVIRAALAEGVAAEHSYTLDPDTRWLGGATPHRDVVATVAGRPARRDAKSVRIENGDVVFARWNAKPFSVTDVDFITLVRLGKSTTGFAFNFDARTATMHADASIEDVWDVPTERANAGTRSDAAHLAQRQTEHRSSRTVPSAVVDAIQDGATPVVIHLEGAEPNSGAALSASFTAPR